MEKERLIFFNITESKAFILGIIINLQILILKILPHRLKQDTVLKIRNLKERRIGLC